MKSDFSPSWKSSTQVRKQRKYRANAPAHTRSKFASAMLSKELRTKHNRRSLRIRKGDVVKVLRGSHKGKESKVERVDSVNTKVYLEKIRLSKRDGTEVPLPLTPSNLMITSLVSEDKTRLKNKTQKKAESKAATKTEKKGDSK